MNRAALSILALLLLSAMTTLTARAYSLADVLSAPFHSDLVAASETERIAWVVNERGVRNVETAAAPDFAVRRLSRFAEDDGQPLSDLALTPDGSVLFFVRGGGRNSAGEYLNAASDPTPPEPTIWAVRTDGSEEPWKVGAGTDPIPAPDGRRFLFAQGGKAWEGSLSEKSDEPAPLFAVRKGAVGLRWSPDGQRVAFLSDRGDHSFVGIFDRESRKILWIAPGVERDVDPVWSPDGRSLAFLRLPGMRPGELYDLTVSGDFAVWVADAATGKARELWRTPQGAGGFSPVDFAQPLRWAGPERLVFPSEHAGWLHLHSVDVATGKARDLTPGPGEAESWTLSADGARLWVSGNFGSSEQRRLFAVPTAGGKLEPVTAEGRIDTHPVLLHGGRRLAFRTASARRPEGIAVLDAKSGDIRAVAPVRLPAEFPEAALAAPESVTFRAGDGLELHGQLFRRAGKGTERGPAVIFLHGGPVRQMLPGFHYLPYYSGAYAFNQYLASRGFTVLSVNFRTGVGYGRAFRQAAGQGPRGASEYQDVLAAARFLRGRPEVDPARIGLWGGSYGGFLTALGLARNSDLFAAGVDLHGVHDWAFRGREFPLPGGAWGLKPEESDLAFRSSPVAAVDTWTSPVLLIHGDDDRNVLFAETVDLVHRLRERKVPVEVLVLPDEEHSFARFRSWFDTYRAAAEFLEKTLTP